MNSSFIIGAYCVCVHWIIVNRWMIVKSACVHFMWTKVTQSMCMPRCSLPAVILTFDPSVMREAAWHGNDFCLVCPIRGLHSKWPNDSLCTYAICHWYVIKLACTTIGRAHDKMPCVISDLYARVEIRQHLWKGQDRKKWAYVNLVNSFSEAFWP